MPKVKEQPVQFEAKDVKDIQVETKTEAPVEATVEEKPAPPKPVKVFQAQPDMVEVVPKVTMRVFHAGRWYSLVANKPLRVSQDMKRVLLEADVIYR